MCHCFLSLRLNIFLCASFLVLPEKLSSFRERYKISHLLKITKGTPSQPCHRSAAISVNCTKSCIYSQKVLLRMGEFVARNMQNCIKKINEMINKRNLLHFVGCLRRWACCVIRKLLCSVFI